MSGKKGGAAGKKPTEKQKKVIEDKTFGLKNKNKSAKVQKYIQTVKAQTVNTDKKKAKEEPKVSKKEVEKAKLKEQNELFKPTIIQQKVPLGVDPKSVLCQYFKQGACTKGVKCKFSHDLAITRKTEKIDVYTDRRDEKTDDLIETWDDQKLENVVSTKQTKENRALKTEIVCRHFIEAIEKRAYGWFWECPNGGDKCIYRHALPPGFVFKKKEKDEKEEEKPPVEETLEADRKLVNAKTPVTLERFLKWKEDKKQKKEQEELEKDAKRKQELKGGKTTMSGREMFTFNPDLFIDDDAALEEYEEDEEIDPSVPHNIIEVTATSLTLRPKFEDSEKAEKQENTETQNPSNESGVEVEVNESLFDADLEDLPDDLDDDEAN